MVDFYRDIKPICMPESKTGSNGQILATNNLKNGLYSFEEARLAGWGWDGRYGSFLGSKEGWEP